MTIAKVNPDSLAIAFRVADAVRAAGLPPAHRTEESRGEVRLVWQRDAQTWLRINCEDDQVTYRWHDGANYADGLWQPPPCGSLRLPAALAAMIAEVAP